jgi:hypothetical protein
MQTLNEILQQTQARRGLEQGLVARRDEVGPYKILPFAAAVQQVVSSRLQLFTNQVEVVA